MAQQASSGSSLNSTASSTIKAPGGQPGGQAPTLGRSHSLSSRPTHKLHPGSPARHRPPSRSGTPKQTKLIIHRSQSERAERHLDRSLEPNLDHLPSTPSTPTSSDHCPDLSRPNLLRVNSLSSPSTPTTHAHPSAPFNLLPIIEHSPINTHPTPNPKPKPKPKPNPNPNPNPNPEPNSSTTNDSPPTQMPLIQSHSGHPSSPNPSPSPSPSSSSNLNSNSAPKTENVSVCVRLRPIPTTSLDDIDLDPPIPHQRPSNAQSSDLKLGSWLINPSANQISLSSAHPIIDRRGTGTAEAVNGSEGYQFSLDRVFDPYASTAELYSHIVQSLVKSCVGEGYNATVFAYGQTGSGKTFTMFGDDHSHHSRGVIPRAIEDVFAAIAADVRREYLLRVSYLEIYNEALKDLLGPDSHSCPPNRLTIHENNKGRVYVNGIREEVVTDPAQVLDALTRGEKARHVGATDWNERSSRSHTVFSMTIESRPKPSADSGQDTPTQISQLNLIDLAGSESAASSSERRKEGSFINKSLLALSNVISKLASNDTHIPYRDSKLTRLLQTSLSGNAKVAVICAVSAGADSVVETLSTLRFARRAKMVVTKAERGTILNDKSALLQAYQQEIISLKAQLQQNSQALAITTTATPVLAELKAEKTRAESELMGLRLERIRLEEQIEHLNRRILTSQTVNANLRRASSVHESRRIVSSQDRRPPRRAKGRATDLGGVLGVIGVGLRASLAGPNENDQAQFERELRLERELQTVRAELVRLKELNQHKEPVCSQADSGLEMLKAQIRALEEEKENNPAGAGSGAGAGTGGRGMTTQQQVKGLEDELEGANLARQQLEETSRNEIEALKETIARLETARQADAAGRLEEQKASKDTERAKVAGLEDALGALKSERESQEQRIKRLEDELAVAGEARQKQAAEQLEERQRVLGCLEQAERAKVAGLEEELEALKSKHEVQEHMLVQLHEELAAAQEVKEKSSVETVAVQQQLEEAQRALEAAEDAQRVKVAGLEEELGTLKTQHSSHEQILKRLQDELALAREAKEKNATSEMALMQERLGEVQRALEGAEEAQQAKVAGLEDELSQIKTQHGTQEQIVKQLQDELAAAREAKDQSATETATVQEQLLALQAAHDDYKVNQAKLLEDSRAQVSALEQQLNTLREEKDVTRRLQQERIDRLEAERAEAVGKVQELKSVEPGRGEAQEARIGTLEGELAGAKARIEELVGAEKEQVGLGQALEERVVGLEAELAHAKAQVDQLGSEKLAAEQSVEKSANEGTAQVERLKSEVVELKGLLDSERSARVASEAQLVTKASTLESELASLSSLRSDTSGLKSKLEKLEQRLSAERSKTQDKELELFQLIQERDHLTGEVERLGLSMHQEVTTQEQKVQGMIEEWEARVRQAEELASEGRIAYAKLAEAHGQLEAKVGVAQEEARRLQAELKTMEIVRAKEAKEPAKMKQLVEQLEQELGKMRGKEKEMAGQLEEMFRRRNEDAEANLQQKYSSKLAQMEAGLGAQIRGLEAQLASIGNGAPQQQTTAESMETIVDLQGTVAEQQKAIEQLKMELQQARQVALGQAQRLPGGREHRVEDGHYHQATEEELRRLYEIVDAQEKRLSDAKTDLGKWQARVRSQTEIISQLQFSGPASETEVRPRSETPSKQYTSHKAPLSPSKTALGSAQAVLGQMRSPAAWASPQTHQGRAVEGSPRPLPVPESFGADWDEAEWRKNRRKTIEKDMAKLKDENVVERKKSVLLSSKSGQRNNHQAKRVLSGMNSRKNRLSQQASFMGNGSGSGLGLGVVAGSSQQQQGGPKAGNGGGGGSGSRAESPPRSKYQFLNEGNHE